MPTQKATVYVVRRTAGGDLQLVGRVYDRGQVLAPETVKAMRGVMGHDVSHSRLAQMVRQGHLEEHPAGTRASQCGPCGALFVEERLLSAHGRKRHVNRFHGEALEVAGGRVDPMLGDLVGAVDASGDREEREEEREAPLYTEKFAANARG